MKTAVVIMAVGFELRFGKVIKQLTPVGANGEIIMEYSIYETIEEGFDKIVFIIRKDIEGDFQKMVEKCMEALCRNLDVEYEAGMF